MLAGLCIVKIIKYAAFLVSNYTSQFVLQLQKRVTMAKYPARCNAQMSHNDDYT